MWRISLLFGVFHLSVITLTACGAPRQAGEPLPTSIILLWILILIILVVIVSGTISFVRNRKKIGNSRNPTPMAQSSKLSTGYQHKSTSTVASDNLKRNVSQNKTPSHIFISYRRSDSADIAGRIYDRLTDRFGRSPIFKDVDSIPLGLDFKEYLDAKVSECSVLLAIIGDRWLEASDEMGKLRLEDPSDFVRIEIESALERGIPVIPLLVRGVRMPAEDKLPASLRKLAYRNGIPIRHDPDFHRDMDRLIAALVKYVQ